MFEPSLPDFAQLISQEDLEPFFCKYVAGTDQLPLEEYLRDAGMDANVEFSEELPRFGYIVHEMLGISIKIPLLSQYSAFG